MSPGWQNTQITDGSELSGTEVCVRKAVVAVAAWFFHIKQVGFVLFLSFPPPLCSFFSFLQDIMQDFYIFNRILFIFCAPFYYFSAY